MNSSSSSRLLVFVDVQRPVGAFALATAVAGDYLGRFRDRPQLASIVSRAMGWRDALGWAVMQQAISTSIVGPSLNMRIDHHPIGRVELPVDSLLAAQAERILRILQPAGIAPSTTPQFIAVLSKVKNAAAITDAVIGACDTSIAGHHHEALVLDVCQRGTGTATHISTQILCRAAGPCGAVA